MKTPREILLQRHRDAEAKLDRIRDVVVANLKQQARAPARNLPLTIILKVWRELILPCRRTWACLATVWLVITLFNMTVGERNHPANPTTAKQRQEMQLAFREQQRVLAEIMTPAQPSQPAISPRQGESRPRSEIRREPMAC